MTAQSRVQTVRSFIVDHQEEREVKLSTIGSVAGIFCHLEEIGEENGKKVYQCQELKRRNSVIMLLSDVFTVTWKYLACSNKKTLKCVSSIMPVTAYIAAVGASMHTVKCIYTRPVCYPCMYNQHIVQAIWKSGQSNLILV